ncbi:hypothetical protein [Scytonema sp. PCC 10023]|uniref:hypothetical protein n=1 Tax=Scytonema sp. PCC 10023 TaxID=1680591 RepID=UPI0039C6541A
MIAITGLPREPQHSHPLPLKPSYVLRTRTRFTTGFLTRWLIVTQIQAIAIIYSLLTA